MHTENDRGQFFRTGPNQRGRNSSEIEERRANLLETRTVHDRPRRAIYLWLLFGRLQIHFQGSLACQTVGEALGVHLCSRMRLELLVMEARTVDVAMWHGMC